MIGYHFFRIVKFYFKLLKQILLLAFFIEETPEQPTLIQVENNFDANQFNDQEKKIQKYVQDQILTSTPFFYQFKYLFKTIHSTESRILRKFHWNLAERIAHGSPGWEV
jgi:hypothetical protein